MFLLSAVVVMVADGSSGGGGKDGAFKKYFLIPGQYNKETVLVQRRHVVIHSSEALKSARLICWGGSAGEDKDWRVRLSCHILRLST